MVREVKTQAVPKGALKIEYEPEVDILTVYFQSPETRLRSSKETESGIILNYSEDGKLTSIEILDASKRYPSGQISLFQ